MSKSNRRHISTQISAQTLYHLDAMREFCGYRHIGHVIDKLVREKRMELNEGVRNNGTSEHQNR